jgi:hypothetical protein
MALSDAIVGKRNSGEALTTFTYSSTLKMKAEYSSETLITIYQTTLRSQKTVIYIVAEVGI